MRFLKPPRAIWRPVLRLAALTLVVATTVSAAPVEPPPIPVAVYVNVDEAALLWPFRDPKTGLFPEPGDARYEEYRELWGKAISQELDQ